MRKLMLILIAFIAVVTFIRALDDSGSSTVSPSSFYSANAVIRAASDP